MRIKKRYIILLCVLLLIVFGSIIGYTKPALPYIQLPGEVYPGTEGLLPKALFNETGITNTFVASLLAWIVILVIAFSLRAGSRTADEVPSGFYNFFEMIVEAAYKFAENIAGPKVKSFFPYFISFLLIILVSNWMGLIPGFDSIGMWEHKPHFVAEKAAKEYKAEQAALGLEYSEEELHRIEEEAYAATDAANEWNLRDGLFMIRNANAIEGAPIETDSHENMIGRNIKAADWQIVPFVRPAATDLNYTLAFAIVAMVMVQYYGFKFLGAGYLNKFFPFLEKGWGKKVGKNPVKAIDPFVGILELVSEISKVLSFSFRLLGNVFAGMVLLFVMAFIAPVMNIVFFGLEFFVGLIQAAVFGLLTLIFMSGAATSHHDEEHAEHH